MPHGDTCVSHLFEPGAIPASAGMTPILPTTSEPPSGQATVAAAIAEAAAATDAVTGIKITATAAMTEAATAASVVNAGLIRVAAIVEGVTATDVLGPSVPATVTEAATAAHTQDASVVAAPVKTFGMSAARAGMHSVIVRPATSKTQIVSDIGAVS